MADVQLAHGYTRIANKLLEACCRAKIPGRHLQVFLAVIRATWGHQAKSKPVSLRRLARACDLDPRDARRILADLVAWNLVTRWPGSRPRDVARLAPRKDFDTWRPASSIAAARRRVARGGAPSGERAPQAGGRSPRAALPSRKRNEQRKNIKTPAAAGVGRGADRTIGDPEFDRAWTEARWWFQVYGARQIRSESNARKTLLRETVAAYPERGRRVLIELVHGYVAANWQHGRDFNPVARMTPEAVYAQRSRDRHLDAFLAWTIDLGRHPPFGERARQRAARIEPALEAPDESDRVAAGILDALRARSGGASVSDADYAAALRRAGLDRIADEVAAAAIG